MIATIIGMVGAAAWLYLIAFRGGFWRVPDDDALVEPAAARSVVAVVPARDEADVIGRAVGSLLAQDYAGPMHVVVVDDHSRDGTAAAARDAAVQVGASDRVSVIASAPMPPGWTGKLWAVCQGVAAARVHDHDYLLLTDADIVHAPHNLAGLVAHAEAGGYDLTSLMVRLHCESGWERLLIPAFVWFFFMLYPPRWVADPRTHTAAAAGGCMLVRRDALERIGGIDSIRGEIIDDCALARRIKAYGQVWLRLAHDTSSIRPYGGWRPIWDMIARCAFAQLRYSALALIGMLLALVLIFVMPPLLLLSGSAMAMAFGAAAWLAMSFAYTPILRFYRCSIALAPLLPLIALFYTAATIGSAVQFWRGRGGRWKGRYQAATP
jgi:hopene-associated glycosyltransferase HpnB